MRTPQRYKLNGQQRGWMNQFGVEARSLRDDWPRRFRNVLLALADLDPGWMFWVERNLPSPCSFIVGARLMEARARALVLRRYNFFGRQTIGDLIIRDDQPFCDDGHLSPG